MNTIRVKHWCDGTKKVSIKDAIAYEVDAAHSERGELEDHQVKIEKLTALIANLIDYMGPDAAIHILREVGSFHSPVDTPIGKENET